MLQASNNLRYLSGNFLKLASIARSIDVELLTYEKFGYNMTDLEQIYEKLENFKHIVENDFGSSSSCSGFKVKEEKLNILWTNSKINFITKVNLKDLIERVNMNVRII